MGWLRKPLFWNVFLISVMIGFLLAELTGHHYFKYFLMVLAAVWILLMLFLVVTGIIIQLQFDEMDDEPQLAIEDDEDDTSDEVFRPLIYKEEK